MINILRYTTREEQINLTTGLTRLVRVADGEEEENMFSETIELTILSFCDGETGLILSNYLAVKHWKNVFFCMRFQFCFSYFLFFIFQFRFSGDYCMKLLSFQSFF